jgi:ubiquinone/menaquinone biosynthesis C-methylase UbiE
MRVTSERLSLGKSQAMTENEHLARYRFAEQFVAGKDVADIACGTGYGSLMLARAGAKSVHGMDISPEAVEYCNEQNDAPNVIFMTANAQDLSGIPDSAFDVVVSFETIEHLLSMEAYLDEMSRILRPGGTFLVSTPDRRIGSALYWLFRRPQNHFHVRELSEQELLKVLSRRFQIEVRFGQAFVSRRFVFWPVQVAFKAFCRLMRSPKLFRFRDNLYGNGGRVEVIPADGTSGIPKFWVILCKKPLKA